MGIKWTALKLITSKYYLFKLTSTITHLSNYIWRTQGSDIGSLLYNIYILPILDIFNNYQLSFLLRLSSIISESYGIPNLLPEYKISLCPVSLYTWLNSNSILLNPPKIETIFLNLPLRSTTLSPLITRGYTSSSTHKYFDASRSNYMHTLQKTKR